MTDKTKDNLRILNQEHKHTSRLMELVYNYTEGRFGDSEYAEKIECDLAIKLLARVGYSTHNDTFRDSVMQAYDEMITSLGKV